MKHIFAGINTLVTAVVLFAFIPGCDLFYDTEDEVGTLNGRVTDAEDSSGIEDALVEVFAADLSRSTGSDGRYEIRNVPEGIYTVRASAEGYSQKTGYYVEIYTDDNTRLDFQLRESGGTLKGRVIDAATELGIRDVLIEIVGEGRGTTTDDSGYYKFDQIVKGFFTIRASREGYITVSIDSVEITTDETTLDFLLRRSGGTLTGRITDAVNGFPLGSVTVIVEGENLSATTDVTGQYTIENVSEGVHSITALADGYYARRDDNLVITAGLTTYFYFSLSPEFNGAGSGILRIVLNWGIQPQDLDAHLRTPEIDGEAYHVFWNATGDSGSAPYAMLNHDEMFGYGPETVTIYQEYPGTYYYYVFNYSELDDTTDISPDITVSGARVQLYDANGLKASFTIPETGDGMYWNVCEIDLINNIITPINRIQDTEPGVEGALVKDGLYEKR